MENKRAIGELIEEEVNKQKITKVHFAEMIHCSRRNVYDIFKRNKIDIIQLKQISKVLKRNFFGEIANDMELVYEVNETEEEREKRIAISNFDEYVPDCLKCLGKSSLIVNSGKEFNFPAPDYGLTDIPIGFTYGSTLKERLGNNYNEAFFPIKIVEQNGMVLEVSLNLLKNTKFINIEITNKTYEEWYEILKFAFDMYDQITV